MGFFHVLNRGVDKREIFLDKQDHFRFIHDLFEFNDEERVNTTTYYFRKYYDLRSRKIERKPRKLLVDIHAFTLMPNHYHLLLTPKIENGIPRFMKKVNLGYAKYFNEKYKRKGTLFEARYKRILVNTEAHFIHLPYYIHLNPLDLSFPEWRNRESIDYKQAMKFLDSYRWSSHLDYVGIRNFPSVTNRDFFLTYFGGREGYKQSIEGWLKSLNLETLKDIILE